MRGRRLLGAIIGTALLGGCAVGAASSEGDVVRTGGGLVRGVVAADHRTFSGIPYAAPPVGDLRWRSPQPAAPWGGVRDATRAGNVCPQETGGSEDCLNLNVTAPRGAERLPVLVWLHGGGFVGGAGSAYDPTRLAVEGGLVVVTINYRLGALGFLDAGEDPAAGNFGLADQQAALRWVRDNIAAFGGGPGNVTLAGQSAGAYSVCAQLAAPGARGLFGKAIIQSGPCANPLLGVGEARRRAADLLAQKGCADLACLRSKPAADLVGLGSTGVISATGTLARMPWVPVIGGDFLPRQPVDALPTEIPLLQGTTRNEMRPFVVAPVDYPRVIDDVFGPRAPAVLAEYPLANYPSPEAALGAVLTDWGQKVGACPALVTDLVAGHGYAYEFAEGDAVHSGDLPYLFGGTGPLADMMIRSWSSFARTGDPGWPAFPQVLSLKTGDLRPVDFAAEHHCAFWG
ncbi:MAG TPA: carboxylesterase family protein [Amycolatopsis sp.]|nr:carboxylesterase family protein [Amycolatopsis sp.]